MKKELLFGLALLAALAALVLGVRYLDGLPLVSGTDRYTATLTDGSGLAAGNAVLLNGVNVGTVDDVRLDPRTRQVRLRLRVDENVVLPEGTTVARGGLAVLGGVSLNLVPGPASAPPLQAGAEIPQSATGDALGALMERGPVLAQRLDTLALGIGLTVGEAYKLLGDPDSDLRSALASLRQTSTGLNQTLRTSGPQAERAIAEAQLAAAEYRRLAQTLGAQAGPLAADARRAAARANATFDRVDGTLTGVDGVVADVRVVTASRRDSLIAAIDGANRTLRTANGVLAEGKSMLVRGDSLLAIVEAGRGNVGMLLNDSTLYLRLDTAAYKANDLLDDFRRNPGRYLRSLTLVRLF